MGGVISIEGIGLIISLILCGISIYRYNSFSKIDITLPLPDIQQAPPKALDIPISYRVSCPNTRDNTTDEFLKQLRAPPEPIDLRPIFLQTPATALNENDEGCGNATMTNYSNSAALGEPYAIRFPNRL